MPWILSRQTNLLNLCLSNNFNTINNSYTGVTNKTEANILCWSSQQIAQSFYLARLKFQDDHYLHLSKQFLTLLRKTNCMKYLAYSFLVLLCLSCNRAAFKSKWTAEKAPSTYVARFETSKGSFDVKVTREWSPMAADRFYQLIRHGVYDNALFYRVVPSFVAQFGSSDTARIEKWSPYKIPDEAVVHPNQTGSIAFARSGKETRGREVFINLKDNPRLDTITYNGVKGFPAFGDVVSGMNVVSALYAGYGDKTMPRLEAMYQNRKQFMDTFPGLDVIQKAYILRD